MSIHTPRRGFMFVLSSPSGAGKTTIAQRVLECENLEVWVKEASETFLWLEYPDGEVVAIDSFKRSYDVYYTTCLA